MSVASTRTYGHPWGVVGWPAGVLAWARVDTHTGVSRDVSPSVVDGTALGCSRPEGPVGDSLSRSNTGSHSNRTVESHVVFVIHGSRQAGGQTVRWADGSTNGLGDGRRRTSGGAEKR
eukprot:GHVU01009941.1.p1 GENE.GHVU01009941.1~~GHVU01009941.1.p1  ORF type:complete len:118 (-),score=0.74 GHVU01009941.1:214-567(-)